LKPRRTGLDAWRLWLLPGMGVKRHVALAVVGAFVMVVGVVGGVLWWFNERRDTLAEPIENVLVSEPWQAVGGWTSLVFVVAGATIATAAVGRLNRSLLSNWMRRPQDAAELLYQRVRLGRGPKIVILGGGTGTSNLLRGLREHTSNLTAIVAVSDDGGSSGRLRKAFDMPAPGDLTDCLAALSSRESSLSRLLQHRFERGGELRGHTFGNLLITTLREFEGDFGQALRVLNELLDLAGAVYPATTEPVTLEVTKRDGRVVRGESAVREVEGPVRSVALVPSDPTTLPEVESAILEADLIVLGPGSLFTSTIPPLLVPGVRDALARASGLVVYVANIMTEAGETDGLDAFDHVQAVLEHGGRRPDVVIVNDAVLDEHRLARYAAERAEPVSLALARFAEAGIPVHGLPLLREGDLAQHDSARLAQALVRLAKESRARVRAEHRPTALGANA
jgi:uncharacterized cofD-like protein